MATAKAQFQEFSSDFKANTGTLIEDTRSNVQSLFSPGGSSTTSRVIGGLSGINSTDSEAVIADILSSGTIKLGFPEEVREFPEQIRTVVSSVLEALKSIKSVLETLRDLTTTMSDILKALLSSIFTQINNLVEMLTSVDAKVRVLPIPPIHPSNIKAEMFTLADIATSAAFCSLIKTAYGETELTKQFNLLDTGQIESRLLGEFGPSAAYPDGSTGFVKVINDSIDDKTDPNRPQETVGFTGGFVIHAGLPFAQIGSAYSKIKELLVESPSLPTPIQREHSARVRIQSIKQIGFDEDSKPLLQVKMSNPERIAPKNLLEEADFLYLPLVVDLLFVENTAASVYPVIKEAGHQNLRRFGDITETTPFNSGPGSYVVHTISYPDIGNDSFTFSPIGATRFFEQNLDFEFILDSAHKYSVPAGGSLKNLSGLFKVRVRFRKFKLKNGEYVLDTSISSEDSPELIGISNTVSCYVTTDPNESVLPVVSAGPPPNWIQYGKSFNIPGVTSITNFFKEVLEDLKALVGGTTNILTSVVNTYILVIEKVTLLITRLSNIIFEIDRLVNLEIGGNFMSFYSNTGVTGIKKAINDYYSEQEDKYAEAKARGESTSSIDWFSSGESVCGAVVICTSESAEKVKRLISLLDMLLNATEDQDTSGQNILTEGVTAGPLITPLEVPGVTPLSLFTDTFSGTSDHTKSPENAC